MEINVPNGTRNEESKEEQLQAPLLQNQQTENQTETPPNKTPAQKAVRKAFKFTAHLSNLLPTGTVLAFHVLAPVFTFHGKCRTIVSRSLTLGLLSLCALSCFLLCFTDSFRDGRGKVRYGFATFRGLGIIDGSVKLSQDEAQKYRIRIIDFVHAFMSILVFAAVAMFDQNVIHCFYPEPSEEARETLTVLPVIVGVICSVLFVLFPSKRHGIGFPLSRR